MRCSAIGLAAVLLLASCSRRQDDEYSSGTGVRAPTGDVRIETTRGELDLALVGDTISAGLAPRALAKARQSTDTTNVNATGLGGTIERLVKSSVQQAVGTRVAFPVSAVKDVRYEHGRIEFEWRDRPTRLFEQTKVNDKPFLESFRPEDAERFVAAVRAKIQPAQ